MQGYRIVVAGQSAMFERNFDPEPQVGDVFQMASGDWFQVAGVIRDPVGPDNPEMVVQARSVRSFPWDGGSQLR